MNLAAVTGPALVVLMLLLACACAPGRPTTQPRRRTQDPPATRLPAVDTAVLLDLLDIALAAGASVPGAVLAVADAIAPAVPGQQLRAAGTALRLGAGWQEAWDGCGPGLQPLADVLGPAWADGVDPTRSLRHRAAAIRDRHRRESREAAARLGARLVLPLGLCFLPAFVLLSMVPVLLSGAGALLSS